MRRPDVLTSMARDLARLPHATSRACDMFARDYIARARELRGGDLSDRNSASWSVLHARKYARAARYLRAEGR